MNMQLSDIRSHQFLALKEAINGDVESPIPVTAEKFGKNSYIVLSCLHEDIWVLPNAMFPIGTASNSKVLAFSKIPEAWRPSVKGVMLGYLIHGIEGRRRPSGGTLVAFFKNLVLFVRFASKYVDDFSQISPFLCTQYVDTMKAKVSRRNKKFSKNYLRVCFQALETLHLLSQYSMAPMVHPWEESSSNEIAGVDHAYGKEIKTPYIPDDVLSNIFQACVSRLESAAKLFELRDKVTEWRGQYSYSGTINSRLKEIGYSKGVAGLRAEESLLLDACMIVVLITSGIRIHELTSLNTGSKYVREDEDGNKQYWIRGVSTKTYEGVADWLVTKVTHQALAVAEILTGNMRSGLESYYLSLKSGNGSAVEIANVESHLGSLFIGVYDRTHRVETLTHHCIRGRINRFLIANGIEWRASPHQFRRTFARYVARSSLGDLRYLREHFKHWSLDMTATYAENQIRDEELHDEIYVAIRDEKITILEGMFERDAILSGGLAEPVRVYRSSEEVVKTYKSRRDMVEFVSEVVNLRSTGVAWCTHDASSCSGGNLLEKTRCGDCQKSLIDLSRRPYWEAVYIQTLELRDVALDCGPGAAARIEVDIRRCEKVLTELGADLSAIKSNQLSHGHSYHG